VVTAVDAAAMVVVAGGAEAVTAVEVGAAEIAETAGTAGRKAFRIARWRAYHSGRRWKPSSKIFRESCVPVFCSLFLQHLRQKSV
jgi:hypothetical protein